MKNRLENKIIVITGGNGLLGSAIIKRLKIEAAFVINLDINHKTNESLSNIACDITSEESINNALNLIMQKYSRIDGLVNNAYPIISFFFFNTNKNIFFELMVICKYFFISDVLNFDNIE